MNTLLFSVFFLLKSSISQLTEMNEQEDVLLEQFVNLPQLKQVINDKDDLVKNIEELASKTSKCLQLKAIGCLLKLNSFLSFFAEKNLLLEPNLEAKRQAVLDKVSC